ncbi:hypothetical protein EDEG_02509 [Edhazardia aedis USNM 41457]|uniref:Uncharacterized protein n=1 Tax=Edhazardia aedis (strain USNM 41457) TaxID=1003232 RepID=J9D5Q7_EDHAE|nr:hypothetical protein EDEG_02509 [Edhazardia aedis USNM 41457]|eukprot:EJW03101.1 hypothetical protein EDEG_02509 [Edhazardia aedis USNM 41457]
MNMKLIMRHNYLVLNIYILLCSTGCNFSKIFKKTKKIYSDSNSISIIRKSSKTTEIITKDLEKKQLTLQNNEKDSDSDSNSSYSDAFVCCCGLETCPNDIILQRANPEKSI